MALTNASQSLPLTNLVCKQSVLCTVHCALCFSKTFLMIHGVFDVYVYQEIAYEPHELIKIGFYLFLVGELT